MHSENGTWKKMGDRGCCQCSNSYCKNKCTSGSSNSNNKSSTTSSSSKKSTQGTGGGGYKPGTFQSSRPGTAKPPAKPGMSRNLKADVQH